jgi:hypothetical protein
MSYLIGAYWAKNLTMGWDWDEGEIGKRPKNEDFERGMRNIG